MKDLNERSSGSTHPGRTPQISKPATTPDVLKFWKEWAPAEQACRKILHLHSTTSHLDDQQLRLLVSRHEDLLNVKLKFLQDMGSRHPRSHYLEGIRNDVVERLWYFAILRPVQLLDRLRPLSTEYHVSYTLLVYRTLTILYAEEHTELRATWAVFLGQTAEFFSQMVEQDSRERQRWFDIACSWYNHAANLRPKEGELQRILGLKSYDDRLRALFYFTKALMSAIPSPRVLESIAWLHGRTEQQTQSYPPEQFWFQSMMSSLLAIANATLREDGVDGLRQRSSDFQTAFRKHLESAGSTFLVDGPRIVHILFTLLLSRSELISSARSLFRPVQTNEIAEDNQYKGISANLRLAGAQIEVGKLLGVAISIVSDYFDHSNTITFMYTVLVYLCTLSDTPGVLKSMNRIIPWQKIVLFNNALVRHEVKAGTTARTVFGSETLPEDEMNRGFVILRHFYPENFFSSDAYDPLQADESCLEQSQSHKIRKDRCLLMTRCLTASNETGFGRKMEETRLELHST